MALRLKLAIVAALATLGLGGWLLLRDSSLFSVSSVTIVGLSADALPAVADAARAPRRARRPTTDFSVSGTARGGRAATR